MLLMGLSFWVGWRYLADHPAMVAEPARAALPTGTRRAILGCLLYVLAIAIAPVSFSVSCSRRTPSHYFAASKSKVPGLIQRAARLRAPRVQSAAPGCERLTLFGQRLWNSS
jgi:hypothetical protein